MHVPLMIVHRNLRSLQQGLCSACTLSDMSMLCDDSAVYRDQHVHRARFAFYGTVCLFLTPGPRSVPV